MRSTHRNSMFSIQSILPFYSFAWTPGRCEDFTKCRGISKFLNFPTPEGFFLVKSPVFGKAKHSPKQEDANEDFDLVEI